MNRGNGWWVAALGLLLLGGGVAQAGGTKRFVLDSAEELGAGELEGTAVRSDGVLVVGADLQRVELPEGVAAWCAVPAPGGGLFVGAEGGRVYRLGPGADRVRVLAETGQLLVSALVMGPKGTLYAGTLPEGRLYAIDVRSGRVRALARPEGVDAIWGLHWDRRGRRLLAATGPEGKLLGVGPRGQVEVLHDDEARHLYAMVADGDGTVYVGSSDGARLLKVRGAQVQVIHDFPGDEITALAVREGRVLAAVASFSNALGVQHYVSRFVPSRGPGGAAARPSQSSKPGKGALWRLLPDGRAERLFTSDKVHPTAVSFGPDGYYVALARKGRVVRVGEDRTVTTWARLPDRLVRQMRFSGERGWLLSVDSGAVHRLRSGTPRRAVWRSEPLDAGSAARWGRLTWRARGRLQVRTRSGPTEEPDASWSTWSAPLSAPGLVRSAAARFLQVEVRFSEPESAPLLHGLEVAYRPLNRGPVVRGVSVAPKKGGKGEGDGAPPSPTLLVSWTAEDPDEDRLRFRLSYRREGWRRWRAMLPEEQPWTRNKYEWDTSGLPDGYYEVRVEASDERDNSPAQALHATAYSEPFVVDNHPPRFERLRVRGGVLRGVVRDAMGPLSRLEVAIDGGGWRALLPEDGLLDAPREAFGVPLADLGIAPGFHVIAVRAWDAAGHAVVGEVEVEVEERR